MNITCTTCGKTFPESSFHVKRGSKRHSQCKYCKRAAIKKHYENHKSKYIAKALVFNKKAKKKLVAEINEIKNVPCADCGAKYPPYVMDFDHRCGTRKLSNVADLVRNFCAKRALAEIEKCDVVCSNCHRIRTHNRHQKNKSATLS